MGRFTYAPAVQDRSGEIRATGYANAANSLAGAFSQFAGNYMKRRDETEQMRGMYETLAQEDPEIAKDLEKFESASYGKKQGMLGAAMMRYKKSNEQAEAQARADMEVSAYGRKREIDAKYAQPRPEFDPSKDIMPYGMPDGSTAYFNRRTGGQIEMPETPQPEETKRIDGTDYLGVYRGGKLMQTLPMAKPDRPDSGTITWPDGTVTVRVQGLTKDFQPDGKGGMVAIGEKEPGPKIITRKITDPQTRGVKEVSGYWQLDESTGKHKWVAVEGEEAPSSAPLPEPEATLPRIMSGIRKRMGK